MNRNQVKETAKEVAGKVQENVGQVTGSTSQQVKGTTKPVAGRSQKGAGDIEKAVQKSHVNRRIA